MMLNGYALNVEERDALLAGLSEEQRRYVMELMARGRKTLFARVMAARKGAHIPEDAAYEEIEKLVDDWVYLRYQDAGVVTDALKCDCGRSLRYAHTVRNLKTGETHTFGISHLEMHTGIDAAVVARIKEGFNAIDFELDELMYKVREGWSLERSVGEVPEELPLPDDIRAHLELGLPLLDRQLARLKRLIRQHLTAAPPRRPKPPAGSRGEEPARDSGWPVPPPEPAGQLVLDLFGDSGPGFGDGPAAAPAAAHAAEAGGFPPGVPPGAAGFPAETGRTSPGSFASGALHLPEPLRRAVREAVGQGMRSARLICEMLITAKGADDSRFSTGKPMIYPAVCAFLDELAADGELRLQEYDPGDRLYGPTA